MYVPGSYVNFTVAPLCRLFSKNNPSEKASSLNIMITIKIQLFVCTKYYHTYNMEKREEEERQTVSNTVSRHRFVWYLLTEFVSSLYS